MSEFGVILHKREASRTGSSPRRRLRLGGETVRKPFRLSKPSSVPLSNLANNHCGINRSDSSRLRRTTKPEKVARQPDGITVTKSFRLSKPSPVLFRRFSNNHPGINMLPSPLFGRPTEPERVLRRSPEAWLVSPLNSACREFPGSETWRTTSFESTDWPRRLSVARDEPRKLRSAPSRRRGNRAKGLPRAETVWAGKSPKHKPCPSIRFTRGAWTPPCCARQFWKKGAPITD
jgi:hypothetical protein